MNITLITVSLLLSAFSIQDPPQEVAGIAFVTDGDTIKVDGHKIRFHGLDAPEAKQSCRSDGKEYQCGFESTQFLISLIAGKEVNCNIVDIDRYKRLVGKCFTSDGTDINASMVSNGHAIAYLYYSQDYKVHQDNAQSAKLGMWAGQFIEPYKWRKGERLIKQADTGQCKIKGNINSKGAKIYHIQSGQNYSQTKIDIIKGEKWFCSEAEAVSAGWRKSKR
jgi:endonuclease YncB( thermonuclease family)